MTKFKLLLFSILAFMSLNMNSQRVITGEVKNASDGSPVMGAAIQIVGTTSGAKTTNDGSYSLSVPAQLKGTITLKVSYLGMKNQTKTVAANDSKVNFSLEEDKFKIDEVVVTAIGIKKDRKSLGYSTQEVKSEDITKAAQGDVFKGLEGKVAGLQVTQASGVAGAGTNIVLRGATSITGSNQPLMVVDGVIIDNTQNYSGNPNDGTNNLLGSNGGVSSSNRGIDLNPEDIESVNVLKGASAAALYGSDASNGAIIITTKKGRNKGETKKGISVSYNTSLSFDNVNKYVPLQTKYSQGSGGKYADPSVSNTSGSWGANVDTLFYIQDPTYTWSSYGRIVGASNPSANKTKVSPFDNQRNFFETGITTDNNISVTGGNDKNQFRFSISDRYQKGVLPTNFYNRVNLSFGANSNISDKFRMSYTLNYVNTNDNKLQQGSNTSGVMLGLLRTPITFDNANGAADPNDKNSGAYMFADGSQRAYRHFATYDNPYWTANNNFYKDFVDRIYGSVQANYDINTFMTLTARFGGDMYSDRRHQYIEINSAALGTGSNRIDNYFSRVLTGDLFVTMPFALRNNWNSTYILGANIYDNYSQQQYNEGNNLIQQGFSNMTNASSFLTSELYGTKRKYSFYGVAKYDWNNTVFVEGTLRMDRTSTLEKDYNTYVYPSLNLGYVFSEDLNLNPKVLSYGKIRSSFAIVGKDAPMYSTKNYFGAATVSDPWANGITFPFNGTAGYQAVNTFGYNKLKNEFTYSYELGAEMKFFQNKLGLDVTTYYNKSTNQIIPVDVSPSTGYAAAVLNAGSLQNFGVEITLNATPVRTKDFRWDVLVNWNMNRNKVLSLYPGLNTLSVGGFSGTTINHVIGQPYGQIYGVDWVRDASGNVVINDDPTSDEYGKPIADVTPKVIGNPNPNFMMGFGNTFTYKQWTLSTLLSWKNGGQLWNGTKGTLITMGRALETENRGSTTVFSGVAGHLDADNNILHYNAAGAEVAGAGGTNTTQTTLDQAWYQGNGGGFGPVASQFVENSDFLKLREIALSYNFSTKSWKTVKSLELGLFLRNVLLWTPYTGIDPEQSLTGASNIQGLDYYNMPGIRSFGIKARLGF